MGNAVEAARAKWAERITTAWRKSVEAVLDAGRWLCHENGSAPRLAG
jgi:hypothetical protein